MSRAVEVLIPVEQLHLRFDEAYDRAEMLRGLIAERDGSGVDVSILRGKFKEAEATQRALLAALRLARHRTVVHYPAAPAGPAPASRVPRSALGS